MVYNRHPVPAGYMLSPSAAALLPPSLGNGAAFISMSISCGSFECQQQRRQQQRVREQQRRLWQEQRRYGGGPRGVSFEVGSSPRQWQQRQQRNGVLWEPFMTRVLRDIETQLPPMPQRQQQQEEQQHPIEGVLSSPKIEESDSEIRVSFTFPAPATNKQQQAEGQKDEQKEEHQEEDQQSDSTQPRVDTPAAGGVTEGDVQVTLEGAPGARYLNVQVGTTEEERQSRTVMRPYTTDSDLMAQLIFGSGPYQHWREEQQQVTRTVQRSFSQAFELPEGLELYREVSSAPSQEPSAAWGDDAPNTATETPSATITAEVETASAGSAVSVSKEEESQSDAELKVQWEQSLSTEWSEEEGGARKLTVVLPKVGGWGAMSSEEKTDLTQQLQQREQQIDDTNRQIAARVEAAKQAAARQEAEERREKAIKERLERAEKAERARLEIEDSFSTMFDGLVRDFEKDWGLASSSASSSMPPPPNLKPLTEEQVQQKERARLQKVLEAKRAEMQVDIATPTEEGYAAKVFLPEGLEKEDVTIKLEEDNATLVITATHRQQQQEGEEGQGAAVRSRERRLRLAKDAEVGAISASFVQGEAGEGGPEALSVAVPKMKPRTITIQ